MRDLISTSDSDLSGHRIPHTVYAELHRGESVVEKQVKEARTKCRSIASLLTDAPNPNSKGVLMFKKRRQRAKKYTLTCFGKAEGDRGGDTEGDTGGETEEEGGSSILSGSEVDEEGFSAFDPTWDTGYLDLLDRKSSACPSTTPTTPTTPTANHSQGLDISAYYTPERLEFSGLESSAYHGARLESGITKQPISNHAAHMCPPSVAMTNGGPSTMTDSDQHLNPNVLNRTARPFTPGPSSSRPSVTSVMFRPPQPKPTVAAMTTKPVAAVSMVNLQPTRIAQGPDPRRAVSSTSLYIPARNNNIHSPPSLAGNGYPSAPFSPSTAQSTLFYPPPAQPFSPPAPQPYTSSPAPTYPPSSRYISAPPISQPHHPDLTQVSFHAQPTPPPPTPPIQPSQYPPVHPYVNMTGSANPGPHAAMATVSPLQAPASDSLASREERIAVPAARTGILHDARRSSNKKPMFCAVQNRDVSPNPDLLSMVQNMDVHFGRAPGVEPTATPSAEAGHESGPEEDWLRLGAEACNFMQAQRRTKPPPVAPKPQAPQVPQLAGKGGELFARRQSRMDRYIVERSPSVAAVPYSPAQMREPSPTPSLPSTWKYSSNIRAPPPISYNPLLSPSCPLKAQKKPEVTNYGGGVPQEISNYQKQGGMTKGPQKTARVYEVKRFSTPPPTSTGPALKVIVPRSATTLGEPMWRSDVTSPPPIAGPVPYQPYQPQCQSYQPQWATSPLSPPPPPAPTAPLPQLPNFSAAPAPNQVPTFCHLPPSNSAQANRQFKSAPDLSPIGPNGSSRPAPCSNLPNRVPRPRFSTSNMGLQPSVWRPGFTMH
ncbi:Synaptopodin 2-like protein [Dissostichus eleginoides]|uniref:Synaptopodin 2-like protein n=1 Tax=Dissostichus eleginoides TaxID=100907 RepID=A0AAD9EXP6_DISEL|nr:Synaptopodin 2-like protein [Dissostichus eleginoides]